MAGGQLSATSRRTASPKWRCGNSPCSLVRRFFTSSSSTNRSLLRVTRNWWQPSTFMPREQFTHMRMQDGRKKHEAVRATGDFGRQRDGPRQYARRLHDGLGRIAPEGILALQFDGEVQALVEYARERMRGIEPDRVSVPASLRRKKKSLTQACCASFQWVRRRNLMPCFARVQGRALR